ncbi:MAG: hypothetical protein ACLVIY_12960 [Anaerobutyricum soehngenii]
MKKKKWNRFLAVVLLAAMAASLLSGCGKKSREQENKGNDPGVFVDYESV